MRVCWEGPALATASLSEPVHTKTHHQHAPANTTTTTTAALQMNVRSLCMARVARDQGEPWLWWEYVDRMGSQCSMKERKFTTDCSEAVR